MQSKSRYETAAIQGAAVSPLLWLPNAPVHVREAEASALLTSSCKTIRRGISPQTLLHQITEAC